MKNNEIKYHIDNIVYHKDVYDYKEPLKVIGITKDKLLLEGDFSGGTHCVSQSDWLSIEGTSKFYNYGFKFNARKQALTVIELSKAINNVEDTTFNEMINMANLVLALTNEI